MTPIVRMAAHSANVGEGMQVRRALPSRQRRMIGAWCFLGPAARPRIRGATGIRNDVTS